MFEIPKIDGLTEDQVLTLMNCRKLSQYISMWDDYHAGREGKCPFCDPLGPKNKIIKTNGKWRMWMNPFPIDDTLYHIMMAPVEHVTVFLELNPGDFHDIGQLWWWAVKEFNIEGGCLAMRFGPPKWNAGSVLHLHANIIVPTGDNDVQVTLAKGPEKIKEIVGRLAVFEKLRTGTNARHLNHDEMALVAGRLG